MSSQEEFFSINSLVAPYTMLPWERLYGLYSAVVGVVKGKVEGIIAECGIAKGGSAALLGLTLKSLRAKRTLWCLDTFEDFPAPTMDDPPEASQYTGRCMGNLKEVKALFNQLGIENYRLIKGLFQKTLPTLKTEPIAVLHLDCDWYESTRCCLENLYDQIVPGGFLQIDDYGHWAGCRKAVDEFFASRNIKPDFIFLDYTAVQFGKSG